MKNVSKMIAKESIKRTKNVCHFSNKCQNQRKFFTLTSFADARISQHVYF